ncbi:hemerythrin domain-containing protein [Sinomonas sp. ASV486]|uniref:hemerythrin domain-containing protein n=1 Tax=Sinomonas sp. ASV486 TaxID=3051170 RepID=UPI0027DB9FB4|nr:hemerythrin domain-containing protein [Sinomonas sp. ASV486]MDQ4490376.1 hemerythrin domain-containing protein [Sinomonas sp. ASV486]
MAHTDDGHAHSHSHSHAHSHSAFDNDNDALAAIEEHHTHMLHRVTALSDALIAAVAGGDGGTAYDEHANLVAWCEDELIPHAVAEEGPLYGPARETPEGRLLVEGMLLDHRTIIGLVEELRPAEGARAAALGLVITRAFALHLRKENELLFPYIARNPDLSLAKAVAGLEEVVGQ